MKKESRAVVYNESLQIEAYRFEGIMQPFPNHFHEHYVIGLVEDGERCLFCRNRNYTIGRGSVVLFNPGDNHACVQTDNRTLSYRGVNISRKVMLGLAKKVTGKQELPGFAENVIGDGEVTCYLRLLHEMIIHGNNEVEKEESLLLLLSRLILNYGQPFEDCMPECRDAIKKACRFMEQHFAERIYLEQISFQAGVSQSTLLRAFARSKGITPYRYLESIRINEAKKLLSKGVKPLEAAIMTGFSDQSHFTNYFIRLTGFTPGIYRKIFLGKDKMNG